MRSKLIISLFAGMQLLSPARAQDANAALEAFVRAQIGPDYRVEVRFGDLPQGTRLAPCKRVEPFLPYGARLWGPSRLGVRCVSGARWTVMLPLNVRVFGQALIATRALRANTEVGPEDFRLTETELTASPGQPLTDPAALAGQMTTRPMRVGDLLLSHHLKVKPTIAAGDPVRIRVLGAGFTVQASGVAMAAAADGQTLRVRTDSGKVLMGRLSGRTVDIVL
ncbi:MAG: flagellar basal body P-ring formation chaperone FlgA [Burkholderiaceae bacterium]